MDFRHSPRAQELLGRFTAFQDEDIVPRDEAHHRELPAPQDPC